MNRKAKCRADRILICALIALSVAAPLRSSDLRQILNDIYGIPSTTGNEHLLAAAITDRLPRNLVIEKEGLGGFAVRLGRGEPRLMVLVPLDDTGFVVGGITPEGYLTLDRTVPSPHPYFDGFLLGNPVIVSTRTGTVEGVVAQPSLHLLDQERRRTLVDAFSLDHAFVDIGARSETEARERGVEILDAVTFSPGLAELASGRLSGPSLESKALCAVLAAAASNLGGFRPRGGIVLVFAAQTEFTARGRGPRPSLGALRAKNRWQPSKTIILGRAASGGGREGGELGKGPVLAHQGTAPPALFQEISDAAAKAGLRIHTAAGADSPLLRAFSEPGQEVVSLSVPVLFGDTPGETIDLRDLETLAALVVACLGEGGIR